MASMQLTAAGIKAFEVLSPQADAGFRPISSATVYAFELLLSEITIFATGVFAAAEWADFAIGPFIDAVELEVYLKAVGVTFQNLDAADHEVFGLAFVDNAGTPTALWGVLIFDEPLTLAPDDMLALDIPIGLRSGALPSHVELMEQ